jgi:N utilization substance protein A
MQVLIPNALQPATVDEVILCKMMGRAIVLVREDQLSLAIGRRGQNVRLASKLCGWDIEIMTQEELQEQIERAVSGFSSLEGVTDELAERLVGEGFLSYDDLSVIEPSDLQEMGTLTLEQVDHIVAQAERRAEEAEEAAAAERRRLKDQERIDRATAEAAALEAQQEAADQTADLPAPQTLNNHQADVTTDGHPAISETSIHNETGINETSIDEAGADETGMNDSAPHDSDDAAQSDARAGEASSHGTDDEKR